MEPIQGTSVGTSKREAHDLGNEGPPKKKNRADQTIEDILSPHGKLPHEASSTDIVNVRDDDFSVSDDEETAISPSRQGPIDTFETSSSNQLEYPAIPVSTDPETSSLVCENTAVPEECNPAPAIPVGDAIQEQTSVDVANASDSHDTGTGIEDMGKKIKWDCARHFSDQTDLTITNVVEDSVVAEPVQSVSKIESLVDLAAVSPPPPRNRCTYGSQCYRKNEDHKKQFCHPGDLDYEVPDNRPECEFGIRCYRKNPQHRRDFKHTIRRRRRPQTPVRSKTPDAASDSDQSSQEESVDESEYDPSDHTDTSDKELSD